MKKNYYMFKMNINLLNVFSIFLMIISVFIFYLIYGNNSITVFNNNFGIIIILLIPYLFLHEILHSVAYVIHGAKFKNITYGIHLEKGILCCLCKQNIKKKTILYSLMYPFFFIGILTLIIGIIINNATLIILSLFNISGCTGDLIMFYHLSKLKDYEFSEYNDPIAFGIYTDKDLSNKKMLGLDYVEKCENLKRDDLRKIVISKKSIIIFIIYYLICILNIFI